MRRTCLASLQCGWTILGLLLSQTAFHVPQSKRGSHSSTIRTMSPTHRSGTCVKTDGWERPSVETRQSSPRETTPLRLKYRLHIHRGVVDVARANEMAAEWAVEPDLHVVRSDTTASPISNRVDVMEAPILSPLPYLTAELPGIGGVLKHCPEAFVVEELPLYEPCGEGDHLFLWIEKRDVSAEMLTQHIASALSISRADVGMAGLKDRRAVTRQFVSVPAECEANTAAIDSPQTRVLAASRHTNKLKTGHLRGNRFEIRVTETKTEPLRLAKPIAQTIKSRWFSQLLWRTTIRRRG